MKMKEAVVALFVHVVPSIMYDSAYRREDIKA